MGGPDRYCSDPHSFTIKMFSVRPIWYFDGILLVEKKAWFDFMELPSELMGWRHRSWLFCVRSTAAPMSSWSTQCLVQCLVLVKTSKEIPLTTGTQEENLPTPRLAPHVHDATAHKPFFGQETKSITPKKTREWRHKEINFGSKDALYLDRNRWCKGPESCKKFGVLFFFLWVILVSLLVVLLLAFWQFCALPDCFVSCLAELWNFAFCPGATLLSFQAFSRVVLWLNKKKVRFLLKLFLG